MLKNKNKIKMTARIRIKIQNIKQKYQFYKNDVKQNPKTYLKQILIIAFILFCPIFIYFLFILLINPANVQQFISHIKDFYFIWPIGQWVGSLVSLVCIYWACGMWYNHWLRDKGGWLTWRTRVYLIAVDLSLNFVIGIYYMHHRETVLGQFMFTCPIALSPLIFLAEFLCVYITYRISCSQKKKK